jgi:alcohol dehydrogenase class IV
MMVPPMTDFVWHDGERVIRFGGNAIEHVWPAVELLTTARAEAGIPSHLVERAAAVRHVPAGAVPDVAAGLADTVAGDRLVAWGGGRVIDVAKALASARGGTVCAVPTTLSGAEMSSGHRTLPGFEDRPRTRPAAVLADARLMTSAPWPILRASAMNALGHAMEALYVPSRNPGATLSGLRAAWLLAEGLDAPDEGGESLALGSILAGYALGATELSLHHVVCQTLVRVCSTPHATTNAVMLPHTVAAIAGFATDQMTGLAEALGVSLSALPGRIAELAGGGGSLRELGVQRDALEPVAEAAAARSELQRLDQPPSREQLLRLLERAW